MIRLEEWAGLSPIVLGGMHNLMSLEETTAFVEARDSSTITISRGVVTVQADGANTFGASLPLTGLTIGNSYEVAYSFLMGTSMAIYVRLGEDLGGYSSYEDIAIGASVDGSGTYTFTATQETHYLVYLSVTDNAYFQIDVETPATLV